MEMRILVATDGTDAALGALHLAGALSERHGGAVEVVTVVPPFPVTRSPIGELVGMSRRELEHAAVEATREQVRDQLAGLGPGFAAWPLAVEVGPPAPTIARVAHTTRASLIVLGLGRHALADRIFGTETALRVMRLAHVPVLAVPADSRELPRTAVVAIDFTDFSRDAAQMAVRLAAPNARIHLAHVLWSPAPDTRWVPGTEWVEWYHTSVGQQLEALVVELEGAAEVRFQTHLLQGDPASELRRLVGETKAELIAAGSHGTGFFGRIVMGSVSNRLVRAATCAVLIAPPRTVPAELERAWSRGDEDAAPANGRDVGPRI